MQHDFSPITSKRDLFDWIGKGAWMKSFDTVTLNRAKQYASEHFVSGVEFNKFDHEGSIKSVKMTCAIQGTAFEPYDILMIFIGYENKWELETDCSCPVTWRCKHSAALLIILARIYANGTGSNTGYISPDVTRWLEQMKKMASHSQQVKQIKSAPKPENRFLAYCIEDHHNIDGMLFVLRVGTRRKDGSVSISDKRSHIDLSRPPKYVLEKDYSLIASFQSLSRKYGRWYDPKVEGEGWASLLNGAAKLAQLYFGYPSEKQLAAHSYREEMIYQPLKIGTEEWVQPSWQEMEGGAMMPIISASRPGIDILPVSPLLYMDHDQYTFGNVCSDTPEELLIAWNEGPILYSNSINEVSKHINELTGVRLPPPKTLEKVEHPATQPTACFNIGKSDDGYLCGVLNVRYEHSPLMAPLAVKGSAPYSNLIGGINHVWNRDGVAENAFVKELKTMGFIADHSGIPHQYRITPKVINEGEVVLEERLLAERILWMKFLESETIDRLRENDWLIEVSQNLGLSVHDVADFFPEIESDADHGIDWFRFDVSHEINGKKVTLIPIIAQAIRDGLPSADDPELPEYILVPCVDTADGFLRFPAKRLIEMVDQVRHLFYGREKADGPLHLDRLAAAGVADGLSIDGSATLRTLARLGKNLRTLTSLPDFALPKKLKAELRSYQKEGFSWLQFLAENGLNGILADDMGLGKTVQTLAHLAAEKEKKPKYPSLVIAPTSVAPNWAAEAEKFTPHLKIVLWHGKDRAAFVPKIDKADLVITSYPLLSQDFDEISKRDWHAVVLDEAQYIKNPKALTTKNACKLKAAHRICLSGTPMENHLGELWSLMRFLMPGFLADEKTFNTHLRKPIERDRSTEAQLALNRRVAPLILRRTKDAVAKDLPSKTEIVHSVDLNDKQRDLYESVRAAMDKRVRDAINEKGLAKSHIIVLDALLKLRQICCHPKLLKLPAAQKIDKSAKLDFLTEELLPTLIEEGRRILLFSTFTSMLGIIEKHLEKHGIPYLKITGQTKERASLVKKFQSGEIPIFLISLKAGGTGLNLTAADTVIHFDPWWNPAAENQATDRAHRIGQTKPVFVYKIVCRGSIEERMLELQKHKSGLVDALLSDETNKLRIDPETLGHLLSPLQT
jgi:superfamily II DNA or RNA helicase